MPKRSLWVWFLSHIYKLLIVRVQALDKEKIRDYENLEVLGVVEHPTANGVFTFTFKRDRRATDREKHGLILRISSYFVEMKVPEGFEDKESLLLTKAILVVKLKVKKTNYNALGYTLLCAYLDIFQNQEV